MSFLSRLAAGALLALALISPVRADFLIEVNYSGDAAFQPFFADAASTWQSLLSGYQDGMVVNRSSGSSYQIGQTIDTLFIDASVVPIDGPGGILGQAGPTEVVVDGLNFTLASDGIMQFDSADAQNLVDNGLFDDVILHEMAHVMGFGTLWTQNGVYVNNSGVFTGANATAAWQSEFFEDGAPVTGNPPVELGGGAGTRNGHWNEVDGGAGLTGITDQFGRDLRDELMTGWLNGNPFISNMTVQSFVDIGFTAAPIPEPATTMVVAIGFAGCLLRRRRR